MAARNKRNPDHLPSVPRPVRLSASGFAVALTAASMVTASVCLPILLHERLERSNRQTAEFDLAAVRAEAEITSVNRPKGRDGKVRVVYRYAAGGREYTSRTSVPRRDAGSLREGALVPIRYLPSDPGQNWFASDHPRAAPVGLVFLIPPVLIVPAGLLLLAIRRQARLLRDGRAAPATVTRTDKLKGRESTTWRVHYEWTLLSGATRSGRYDSTGKTPPARGTAIPIVYDRDNPRRHARYPLSLVRIAGRPM